MKKFCDRRKNKEINEIRYLWKSNLTTAVKTLNATDDPTIYKTELRLKLYIRDYFHPPRCLSFPTCVFNRPFTVSEFLWFLSDPCDFCIESLQSALNWTLRKLSRVHLSRPIAWTLTFPPPPPPPPPPSPIQRLGSSQHFLWVQCSYCFAVSTVFKIEFTAIAFQGK